MPYKIVKRGNGPKPWVKIKKTTGEVVSRHATKGKAMMSAYYAMKGER